LQADHEVVAPEHILGFTVDAGVRPEKSGMMSPRIVKACQYGFPLVVILEVDGISTKRMHTSKAVTHLGALHSMLHLIYQRVLVDDLSNLQG